MKKIYEKPEVSVVSFFFEEMIASQKPPTSGGSAGGIFGKSGVVFSDSSDDLRMD